jgi:hypothetical protein
MSLPQTTVLAMVIAVGTAGLITAPHCEPVLVQ